MADSTTLRRALDQVRSQRTLPSPIKCRQIRLRTGVTQQALADAVGVGRATVCRWEAGSRTPTGDNLLNYLEVLDLLD